MSLTAALAKTLADTLAAKANEAEMKKAEEERLAAEKTAGEEKAKKAADDKLATERAAEELRERQRAQKEQEWREAELAAEAAREARLRSEEERRQATEKKDKKTREMQSEPVSPSRAKTKNPAAKNNWSSDEDDRPSASKRVLGKDDGKPPRPKKTEKGGKVAGKKDKGVAKSPKPPDMPPPDSEHAPLASKEDEGSASSALSESDESASRRGSVAALPLPLGDNGEMLSAKQQRKLDRANRRRRRAERRALSLASKVDDEKANARAAALRASEVRRRRAQTGILVVRLLKASALPRKKGTKHFFTLTLSFHSRNLPQTTFTSRTFQYERSPVFDQEFTFIVNNASVQRLQVSLDDNFKAWTQKSLDSVEIALRDIRQADLGVMHQSFAFEKGPGSVDMELRLTPTESKEVAGVLGLDDGESSMPTTARTHATRALQQDPSSGNLQARFMPRNSVSD